MWKIENGQRVENLKDIVYLGNMLVNFYRIIRKGYIAEDGIYKYYKLIMTIPERDDRIAELESMNKQLDLYRKYDISDELREAIFSVIEKKQYVYKPFNNEEKSKVNEYIQQKAKKFSVPADVELQDKATIIGLYRIARITENCSAENMYVFYMEMLALDKSKRAEEVEKAYKQLCIEFFIIKGLITKKEGKYLIQKIGRSKLLEKVRRILATSEE